MSPHLCAATTVGDLALGTASSAIVDAMKTSCQTNIVPTIDVKFRRPALINVHSDGALDPKAPSHRMRNSLMSCTIARRFKMRAPHY